MSQVDNNQSNQQGASDKQPSDLPWSVVLNITGKVQGVFYRASAVTAAQRIGVYGYAQNLPDGSVEVLAQGTQAKVDEMINWCHRGSPMSRVESVHQVAPLAQVARAKQRSFYVQRTGIPWKEEMNRSGSREFAYTKDVPRHPLDVSDDED